MSRKRRALIWMVERQFRLADSHPTHGGVIIPVRSVATGTTEKEAAKSANDSSEEALITINGVGKGEWVGNAVVLYPVHGFPGKE